MLPSISSFLRKLWPSMTESQVTASQAPSAAPAPCDHVLMGSPPSANPENNLITSARSPKRRGEELPANTSNKKLKQGEDINMGLKQQDDSDLDTVAQASDSSTESRTEAHNKLIQQAHISSLFSFWQRTTPEEADVARTGQDENQAPDQDLLQHQSRTAHVVVSSPEHCPSHMVQQNMHATAVASIITSAPAPQPSVQFHPAVPTPVDTEVECSIETSEQDAMDEEEEEEDNQFLEFDPFIFMRTLPPLETLVPKHRQALLPRRTRACKQKTLVLDLDETLVHSSLETVDKFDFQFPVEFNNQQHMVYVRQRPHMLTFLQKVSEMYEVVIFTASQKVYAEKLLNIVDPTRTLVKHKVYRDSCIVVDGNYLKDLTILGRDLASTLIIDNSPQAFGFQVENGVPIESWYDDESDDELLKLLPFLEQLVHVDDVRPHIREKFKLHELIDQA